ncbi:MAG: hypothetical protein ABNH00_10210 [Dokdonia sp.]|uniref:hypothetical protein n=1 Tax=unclassified Maribacter TaxID=2615042 RepID=UPI000EC0D896|nr:MULTISPECIES: hypothetical protein [unclassified Maribacter]HAF78415.1 hypothetical protein [Maribacter sp.]HIB48128.1 hypothetical protein [Flavobacteriaceae bacterium]HIN99632.1 hypothetical protein [Flavobacteriaceae bacterium]
MKELVTLKSSHVYLDASLVDKVFDNIHYAYVTYVVAQGKMLITPVSSQWFVKMHEPTQFLLKSRNLKGDRTLAIREILIDNDLDTSDRVLHYEVVEKTNLIKIDM